MVGAAEASPREFRGLIGPDRVVLYLTAAATGPRAEELGRLTPAMLDLDADIPLCKPGRKASSRKSKKISEQPLPPTVAAWLRVYLAGRQPDQPVWPGTWYTRSSDMFKLESDEAGVPSVVGDEVAVFHSLRHTYTTLLSQTAPVKVIQELARHSTPVLTIGRYSHAGVQEKADAVARLPPPGRT